MISVVIPVYNEEENVSMLYEKLRASLDSLERNYEIIYIDDGSSDNTYKNLLIIHEIDKNVKIIKFKRNFGQTAAISAGFDYAKGNIIITMDGDLQNDPGDIPQLLKKLGENDYDVVCGWRFERKDPISKRYISKLANILRRFFTGTTIHDSGCTLRAYKRDCLKDLDLYGEMHRYIPALLMWKGYNIGEMKVTHRERIHGKTKYNWKRIVKGLLDLIVVTFWQRYSARPVHIFGATGLILGFIGIFMGICMGIQRLFFDMSLADRPLFILSVFLIVIGIQFVTIGILSDIMIKIYYSQRERKIYLVENVVG